MEKNINAYVRVTIGIKSGEKFVSREKLDIDYKDYNLKNIHRKEIAYLYETIQNNKWFTITDHENELYMVSILTEDISYFKVEIETEDNIDSNSKNYTQRIPEIPKGPDFRIL